MGIRFRKSINLGEGLKLNINKKSFGISAGTKGSRVSINSKGRRTTSIGIPGTGLSYVSSSQGKINKSKSNDVYEEIKLTEELVINKYKEWKIAGNILLILSLVSFICAFPLGVFLFFISIVFFIFGVVFKITSNFIKKEGFKQLNS